MKHAEDQLLALSTAGCKQSTSVLLISLTLQNGMAITKLLIWSFSSPVLTLDQPARSRG